MPIKNAKPGHRRVALLIDSSRAYSRQLISGVARFNQEHRHWRIEFTPRDIGDPLPGWLSQWQGDGILARIEDTRMADAIRAKRVPFIDLRRAVHAPPMPSMGPDNDAIATMVFEHFRARGFHRYGFVGHHEGTLPAFDERAVAFRRLVLQAGFEFAELRLPVVKRGDAWERQCRVILGWLRKVAHPMAVMCSNDDIGLRVLDACRCGAIPVPDHIAVAGVGNDACLCELAVPPLTSVDLDPARIGYEAAAALERMMQGKAPRQVETRFAPRGIVARISTDVMAIGDETLARAIRFIREGACQEFSVEDVLRYTGFSRTALDARFRRVLGRTVHQEIQHVRLERVKHLLADTDKPIKEVALLAGFHQPEYMMRVFRRHTGQTPAGFRKRESIRYAPRSKPADLLDASCTQNPKSSRREVEW
jgi:LacI family transcriptional regulator